MRIEAPTRVQDAPDVNEETFADQDFLQWDATLGRIIGTAAAIAASLAGLTDVTLTGTAQGDLLYRNAIEWVNLPPSTSGRFLKTLGAGANPIWSDLPALVTDLESLTDVDLTSPAQGDVLYRNAVEWVNLPAGTSGQFFRTAGAGANPAWATLPTSALDDLTDVAITAAARGQILYRDATQWVNLPPGTSGQFLRTAGAGADPAWATLPTTAFDDLTDVTLTTVARGDILYRGASDWNNLPPATAGFILTTNGAGADPSWQAPAAANLAPAVILLPTTDGRNVIQPSADTVQALILQGFSPTHSDPLLETRSSAGTPLSQIGPTGRFIAPLGTVGAPGITLLGDLNTGWYSAGADEVDLALGGVQRWQHDTLSSYLYVTPGTTDALRIYSNVDATAGITTRDVAGLILRGKYWTGAISANADAQMDLDVTGNGTWNLRLVNNGQPQFLLAQDGAATFTKTDTGSTSAVVQGLTINRNVSGTPGAGFGSRTAWRLESGNPSGAEDQLAASVDVLWATATHASRAARLLLNVEDAGGTREGLRIDTDGTNAQVAIGGANVASSVLTASSTRQGFLPPRMTTVQRDAIVSPVAGLTIYNNDTAALNLYTTSWGAVGSADLSPAVILLPTTDARNVIQPSADTVKALVVKQFSGTHSDNLFEVQDSTGARLAHFDGQGRMFLPRGSTTVPAIQYLSSDGIGVGGIYFNNNDEILFQSYDSTNQAILGNGRFSINQSAANYRLNERQVAREVTSSAMSLADGYHECYFDPQAGTFATRVFYVFGSNSNADIALSVWQSKRVGINYANALPLALLHAKTDATTTIGQIIEGIASQTGVLLQLRGESSTTPSREMANIDTAWATATDASRKARLVLSVYDTAVREGLRIEASGSAPMMGVLGAGAVVRQTVTGSRGGNAALASLLTAMATFGWITDSTTA